ncbi:MAG: energy-coupling factor transporter transmembrane protein EcfT [Oscillospiraceae bacterium]|nr:energy-coupling factor transporter transmembrane protein EcfT [Oscillospiraceae bacterium]
MLNDITLGQYFPGNSPLHKMDPRIKILLTVLFVVSLFLVSDPLFLIAPVIFIGILYLIARIPVRFLLKSLKPLIPILIFTTVLNLFFLPGDVTLFSFWVIQISDKGLLNAILVLIRIVCLIAGSSLLTYTTSPIALTDGIERLLSPLGKLKFPVHDLAMMMSIALRFIPTLIEETEKIMSAQKARGADMETGSLVQRAKALVPILIPLLVSAFRRAEELALAMECRCYRGGEGRTRMKQLKLHLRDLWGSLITVILCGGMIALGFLL